jgi:aspartyl-tRNA(Asn)/glutamyl-tRNA(Gln) amidotransferase subunit C
MPQNQLEQTDIHYLAQLAQLALTPEEEAHCLGHINKVLVQFEQMCALDTTGIVPLSHPLDSVPGQSLALRLMQDQPNQEAEQREANQCNAPAVAQGLFLVPKVLA